MNNDSKEPLKGKELRDLARSEPGQALIYLENNKEIFSTKLRYKQIFKKFYTGFFGK